MFNKKSSRHSLALFVALALGSGAFLTAAPTHAADVNGQNVEIDDAHVPSDNVVDPGGGPAFGTAAGFIGNASDSGNVTNNTLTFNGRTGVYGKSLFGGFTFGTGTVEGNRVFVNPTTTPLTSSVDGNISGGVSNGGGNVKNNHAVFDGDYLYSRKLIGGMAQGSGAGIVQGNTALLKGNSPAFGAVPSIYGGMATDATNGDVLKNEATIEGGHASSVYGGYADTTGGSNVIGNTATIKGGNIGDVHGGFASGTGKVTGNTVTIKGGIINGAYGGYSEGSGEVSGNIVNLGDGTGAMAAGYAINGTLFGGQNTTDPNKVSNNTLNVKTNAEAHNIKNFSTINFNFNAHTNTTQSLLTLTDTAKTKLQSLKQLDVKNAPVGKGTLMENANGIDVAESGTVGRTEEKTETLIQKDGTTKIAYRTYQFKDSTALDTDGTDVWGGRSRAGNATTGNHVTLNGNYTGNAYGGWTTKFATTVTGESEKNHSKANWITLEGTTSQVQMMNGGETNLDGGDAADNHAILKAGTVHSHLTGGESVKGNATHNFVDISGGTVHGQTAGGAAGNAGKAESNEVTITNGTLNGDAHGGETLDGDAEHNIVTLTGGTTEKIYGGHSSRAGKATHNIVKLSGASALDVYGGYAKSNDTEHNTVEISSGTARSVYGGESDGTGKAKGNIATLTGGTLTGDIFGGSAKNGDAVENHVNITGGSAAGHDAYGGFSTNGNATGNTVDITGGSVRDVYGGGSTSGNATGNTINITGGSVRNVDGGRSASGDATGNTVNIGSADAAFGGSIAGIINGGSGTTYGKDYRTGNTLNVYGNATASNIRNFAEINFHFNSHVNQSASFLNLSDGGGTTIESLGDIHVDGEHGTKGTLLQNTSASGSITITDGQNRRIKTSDDKELILEKSTDDKKITYEGYRFANATEPTTVTEGSTTNTWGGRSIVGNSTRKNVITVTSGTHTNIYGGWTAGSGTTADDKDNSYKNEVTLDSGATTGKLYGGYVDTDAGNAEENTVTVKNGTVTTAVYGGTTNKVAGTGYVKKNIVNISGGTVSNVYGGYSAGSGEVLENEVTATGGTLNGSIHGGQSTTGAATGNIVTLKNVTVSGNVTGGDGATTTGNIVNLNGDANVTGDVKGGTQANGTGNTLNVKGANSAANITGFQKLHFDTDTATGTPMLTLSTAGAALTLASIEANGAATENPTTLLHNAAGLNVADAHQPKSTLNAEGTRETNLDVRKTGTLTTDIVRYAYTFKGARTPVSVTEGGVTNTWGGRSKAGNTTTDNKITVASGTHTNVYGGWTAGSGTTAAADKQNDSSNNTVTVTGGTVANLYGGYTEAAAGHTTGNTVNIGDGEHALASGTSLGTLSGGNKDATANTLNVRANATASQIENFSNVTFEFNHVINRSGTLLNLTNTTGTTLASLSLLNVSGTPNGSGTLIQNSNGVTISDGVNTRSKTGDTTEATFQAHSDKVTYEGYTFKGVKGEHAETTDGANTWGGRSKLGNTTTENEITVSAHNHTNVYGGWTTGTGSTAAADKQKNSIANKVKVNGSASITGTVYGGFTNVAGGKATANEVTVTGGTVHDVVGGQAAGEASGNTVTVSANANAITGGRSTGDASGNIVNLANATIANVTGGEGATTNNNTINLNGNAQIAGTLTGGSQANGTGNTLNVKGKDNKAGTISNIQNMNFDATGLAKGDTMLEATGAAQSDVDWTTLRASGAAAKPLTLLKNDSGINLAGYTGAVKSETTDTTETNIDVRKTGGKVTEITYEGYQFKGVTQATTDGDTFAGISKAGNSTRENEITVAGGIHANVYGGWTTGSGTTAADKDASYKNKVTVNGSANVTGTVYGGFTNVAGGKATANEVTVTGGTVHDVVGGEAKGEASGNTVTVSANAGAVTGGRSAGEASNNTVNLANATVSSVTGGEGATTNNNTINLNGNAQVTGALKGGSQANGTGNTLNVNGKDNKAGTISNVQNMNFDATGLAKGDTMLEATDAGETDVDWTTLRASGMATKPLTLLKNDSGINLAGYTGAAKSETTDTTETNIDIRKTGGKVTEITYEGYQFKGVTQATTDGDTFGGISKAGNSTRENEINVESGTHANVYGGWTTGSGTTAADKGASYKNKVKVSGSANVTNTVYGGFAEAAGGKATSNEVTVTGGTVHDVVGGEAKGEASGNTVTVSANAGVVTGGKSAGDASGNIVNLANATITNVTGGEGAATNDNTVNLNGGANVTGVLKGGSAANGTGNTLNVNGVNRAGSVTGFQKMNFDATGAPADAAMMHTTGATDVNWETLTVKNASASEKPLTLLENANGINISGRTGDAARSELNADATMETNIDVRQSGGKVTAITYEGYTFKGATKATTYGVDTWAGRSKAGNTTQDNKLTLDDASKTYANVYGGWTSGTGTKAAADKQNNSLNNTVDYTAGTVTDTLYGGYAANGEASGNTVNLGAITTAANIYGGFGTATKNNTINLKDARITGTVYGGSDANGTGNTLAVYKPSEVHDFAGVQNLHFYTDEMAAGAATPMLKLGTATKDIRGLNIGVARSGAAPKLIKGDKILLMKTAGGALATDAAIQNKVEGMQGVSRRYEYEIKQEATGELTATVTKAGFAEQAKSLVETRAGLASFVNQGADYLVQDGLAAAEMSVSASDADKGGKNAQRQGASSDGAAYQLWAGAGANSMRAESGSYVDSKGWNLGVGWAREDVQKDGAKVLFSPFVEYGRGTYDSYLDDGTHGSGKVSYIGAGILGKLTQKDGLWLEGSLRAGRSKSDYSANLSGTAASYDGSNTYYGAHLGAGKTFAIKENSSIDAYARYFWSHQNSMTATLNTGDLYEFGSVNSQRLRLGLRYSLKDKTTGEFYAGLAWEHEFAGKAGATYQGDAAPSPSLKGSSYMLELGYRFMPENSRVSYDLHLNGWQGQRKGITGGASVKWTF